MSVTDQQKSSEFQLHIRNLLYEYSKCHLTTDYVTFTENVVAEFLEDLKPVPLTDPYSFVLPVDPFETFSQMHSLSLLPPYEENAETTKEALTYLKSAMSSFMGPAKSERLTWSDPTYEPLPELLTPVLTRTARKKTPKLGNKVKSSTNFESLAKEQKYKTIDIEPVDEPKLQMEEILRVNHQIDEDEVPAVRSLLQKTADMMRPQKFHQNRYLDPSFLRNTDSLAVCEPVADMFKPIFPRSRLPGFGGQLVNPLPELKGLADLPSKTHKIEVEEIEHSPSRMNLVIVDGWETIKSSPPSTPSGMNSDSDENIDQLEFPSSPDTELPLVEEVEKSKLGPGLTSTRTLIPHLHLLFTEEILIPRSRRIGGKYGIMPHILHQKTLTSFLQPLLTQAQIDKRREANEPDTQRPDSPVEASSMVGQPPSECDDDANGANNKEDEDLNFDRELKKIYDGNGLEDMILDERIDDKQDMLMDIPILPPPNAHPQTGLYVPKSFSDYVVPAESLKGVPASAMWAAQPLHRFLRKTKGVAALSLQLSWTLFTTDEKLPSVEALVGVSSFLDENNETDENSPQVKVDRIIKSVDLDEPPKDHEVGYAWTSEYGLYKPPVVSEEIRILLTRQERKRIAKLKGENEIEENSGDDHDVEEHQLLENQDKTATPPDLQNEIQRLEDERPAKRPRLDQDDDSIHQRDMGMQPPSTSWSEPNARVPFWDEELGILEADDDKENWPPHPSSSMTLDESAAFNEHWASPIEDYPIQQPHIEQTIIDSDGSHIEESFEPLSFESRHYYKNGTQDAIVPFHDNLFTDSSTVSQGHAEPLCSTIPFFIEPEIASRTLGISSFAQLRSRKISQPAPAPALDFVPSDPIEAFGEPDGVPTDIIDINTIVLPETRESPQSIHRYMASLDFIQKHALVRSLRSDNCAVELVERHDLGGVDLIVDPYCAIIFVSIFMLPAKCDAVVESIALQSWKFSSLLVVFEAYPEQCSKKISKNRNTGLYAYTPPIIKAVKRFRRDIDIADACGKKRPGSQVLCAFADNVNEAALLCRLYGDRVEAQDDTSGALWGQRAWLTFDFLEDEEQCLAGVNGMNHFTASIILSQISMQDFVNLLPEERMEVCTGLISSENMMECNADIEARFQAIAVSSDISSIPS